MVGLAIVSSYSFAANIKVVKKAKAVKATKSIERPRKPASIKTNEFAVFIDKQYTIVKTKKFDGLLINAECSTSKPCEALSAVKKTKVPLSKGPHPALQHPAAHHCADLGGKNLIAINANGEDENLCRFGDSSYINSWDLYYKHFPKTVIK